MLYQKQYTSLDNNDIKKEIINQGFDPIEFFDPPGRIYNLHQHPETKLLAFLEGSMNVTVGDKTYLCEAGDKLIIPSNKMHSAIVGPNGCRFYWSEKLLK